MIDLLKNASDSLLYREYMLHGMGDEVDSFMYALVIAMMLRSVTDSDSRMEILDKAYGEWVSNTGTISSRKTIRRDICDYLGMDITCRSLMFASRGRRESLVIYLSLIPI